MSALDLGKAIWLGGSFCRGNNMCKGSYQTFIQNHGRGSVEIFSHPYLIVLKSGKNILDREIQELAPLAYRL